SLPGRSPDAGAKTSVLRRRSAAEAEASARARQLPLYDVADELHDGAVARDADRAAVKRVHPVPQSAVDRQAVELGAIDRHVDARVARRVLRDLRAGDLHAP